MQRENHTRRYPYNLNSFLKLTPEYRDYVWGGDHLRPGQNPTAEAWVVFEGDKISSGVLAGKTLGEAAAQFGKSLLGTRTVLRTGTRFPLLIKILDCAQWLSLQVHPNDKQAVEIEGPGQLARLKRGMCLKQNLPRNYLPNSSLARKLMSLRHRSATARSSSMCNMQM